MDLVSVIVPCYNHGRFLGDCLESVLAQSYREMEVLVVDDCSTDNTRQVIAEFMERDSRVRLITHERNLGLSLSRNHAMAEAAGEWVGFCDADDMWLPQKLTRQLEVLRNDPRRYDIVYSASLIVDGSGRCTGEHFTDEFPVPGQPSGNLFVELCQRNFINIPTALVRRSALTQPCFDPSVALVNDWGFWINLARNHEFRYIDEPLVCYRVHENSTGRTQRRRYEINRFKVLKRTLRRYADLPEALRSHLWYHLGICLLKMERRRQARRYFWHSFREGLASPRSTGRSLRSLARIVALH